MYMALDLLRLQPSSQFPEISYEGIVSDDQTFMKHLDCSTIFGRGCDISRTATIAFMIILLEENLRKYRLAIN